MLFALHGHIPPMSSYPPDQHMEVENLLRETNERSGNVFKSLDQRYEETKT